MTTDDNQVGAVPTAEWLTAVEAAGYLKVKVRTLLLWVRQGKVKAFALSGTKRRVWRFRHSVLDAALLNPPCYHPNRHPCALLKGWINEKGSTAQNRKCSVR
jgi:excisionase family DNA binding protein